MRRSSDDPAIIERLSRLERRDFLKAAAAAAATGAIHPAALLAREPWLVDDPDFALALSQQQQQEEPPIPLGNGEHPALVFQANPGGTGMLYDRWNREGIDPFAKHSIPIEPWVGYVPGDPVEIAFLPVHRLAALIQGRHISSVELTEIYLERMKRYDPVLLCAVSILEGRALEEAQQADHELRNYDYRGPLHGIPWSRCSRPCPSRSAAGRGSR